MDDRGLKPCPFCGGEAELKFYGSGPATRSGVRCVDVMCAGSMRLPLPKENSVAMWNTRTPADRLEEREGWREVESAPLGRPLLCADDKGKIAVLVGGETARSSIVWADPLYDMAGLNPTHWMPLPAPPARTPND